MDLNNDGKRTYRHAFPKDAESSRPRKKPQAAAPQTPRRGRVRQLGKSNTSRVAVQPPSASKVTTPRAKGAKVNFVDACSVARTREAAPSGAGGRSSTVKPPTTPTSMFSPHGLKLFGHAIQFMNTGISPLMGRGVWRVAWL